MRAMSLISPLLLISFIIKARLHEAGREIINFLLKKTGCSFHHYFLTPRKRIIPVISFLVLSFLYSNAQPVVTVRFANPEYVCATQTYSVDVEFQCNTANKELFGINVRFFYADNILEFLSFGEYIQGYGPQGSPTISTGNSSSGMTLFGFQGPSEFVNGAVQKNASTPVTYMSTSGWTKIFNISFHVDDPNGIDTNSFCPSLIWDLKENPAGGGISGSEGVVITVVTTYPNSGPTTEHCVQFNWQYDGVPGLPHGFPVSTNCISTLRTYAPKTTLPMCGSAAPGTINVPVTVTNFTSIGHFDLVFEYDPAVITYVSSTPNAIFNTSNGLLNVSDSASTAGKRKIKMNYQRQGNVAISLSNGAHLTDLQFSYISGATDLSWKTSGNACHYLDSLLLPKCDLPYSEFYINGMVVSLLAPLTKIDSNYATEGDFVTYAVRVWDFTNIHALLLTLDYDPDVLVYYEAAPNAAISSIFEDIVLYDGRLELGWFGNDTSLADGSVLAYLTFEYMGGEAPLLWFDNGCSCQYTECNTNLPLSDVPAENFYINGNVASAEFIWSGGYSSDWNSGSNWVNNEVPGQFTDVIIDPSSNPSNWPTFTGNLTIGEECKNLILNDNAQLTISGDLTINPGHTLEFSGPGTLKIGGDWINSGIFLPGAGTVEFTGTADGIIDEGVPPGNYVAAYILSTFSAGMTPITGGTAGPSGDNSQSDVTIGFNFNYLGINYAQARINTNGWMSLNLTGNNATSGDNTILFSTAIPATTLAPWWDDLKADASTTIGYLTEGTSPARVFTAEWKNILAYNSAATARLNFQVKLYETTNIIEFHYGSVTSGTHNAAERASIGIKDATGGPGNFIEATHNSTNLIIAFLKSETDWPAVNYRFTPPPENAFDVFNKLVITKLTGKVHIQRDVQVTGIN